MDLLPGIESTASALDAERLRMNVVAENIANAFTTKGPGGTPYKRKIVTFESVMNETQAPGENSVPLASVSVRGVSEDQSPLRKVYNPGHPDADAKGMVTMPNVDVSREMVDLIVSSRAYEANTQAARTARQMARTALTIGNKS